MVLMLFLIYIIIGYNYYREARENCQTVEEVFHLKKFRIHIILHWLSYNILIEKYLIYSAEYFKAYEESFLSLREEYAYIFGGPLNNREITPWLISNSFFVIRFKNKRVLWRGADSYANYRLDHFSDSFKDHEELSN